MQGTSWDWYDPEHRALDGKLLQVLTQMSSLQVLHGDLGDDHILVTADHQVFLLDFGNAVLSGDPDHRAEELADWQDLISYPLQVQAGSCHLCSFCFAMQDCQGCMQALHPPCKPCLQPACS